MKITNDLLLASDLDLNAAFHRIDHNILLQRLGYVIKGTALGWFKSYLSDRFQLVCVDEESYSHSSFLPVQAFIR